MKKLENPQQQIYQYILSYKKEHAYPPSVREICEAVGLTSTATVHVHLKNLERKGLIVRNPSKQRSIQIVDGGISKLPSGAPDAIPLIGQVAAGMPVLAVENIEDSFPLPEVLLHGSPREEVFMLRVTGESMKDAGICDGDIIVVNHDCRCEDGDVVVARVQGESATVKRLYREPDCARLQPENDLFAPIRVPYDELEIAGKVIGLMRAM